MKLGDTNFSLCHDVIELSGRVNSISIRLCHDVIELSGRVKSISIRLLRP